MKDLPMYGILSKSRSGNGGYLQFEIIEKYHHQK